MVQIMNCDWCGKLITYRHPKLNKKYCSFRCQQAAYRDRQKQKCLNIPEDPLLKNPQYRIEDYNLRFTDKNLKFTENDNNWGLGESNLTIHPAGDKTKEAAYIKKELKRIFKRKPNP